MNAANIRIRRLGGGPIIYADLDPSIGENIQGPSLIRVPDWVEAALGRYYLYFADHKGSYIRLAYADELTGPWQIYVPGSLKLADSHFPTEPPEISPAQLEQIEANMAARGVSILHDVAEEVTTPHIASPDVHVDDHEQQIIMYFHGLEGIAHQVTRVASSKDGIHFQARPDILGQTYFRGFKWHGHHYGLAMPGQFYRSAHRLGPFEKGPKCFNANMRHAAVWVSNQTLWVFWTQVGDAPEHIKLSFIDLSADWSQWQPSEEFEVLRPEFPWEGALATVEPSVRSTAYGKVNQLRDPAVYVEDNQIYLLYAVAGESGIALAQVDVE